jgi:hypothetical protein
MYILGCYALFIGVCFLCCPCVQTFYFSNSARYTRIRYDDPLLGTNFFAGQNEFMDFPVQAYVPRYGHFYVHAQI